MQSALKVSIVTIVYNSEKTLEDTIKSVLSQTYPNIEYIIIDGGSTDKSMDIVRKYQTRISKVISEPDRGISDAFNKGIKHATGDLIGILNADDYYTNDAVETVVECLDERHDVYCANLNLLGLNDRVQLRKSKVGWLNFGMYIMHPTTFVRKAVYNVVGGYDVQIKIAMDFDMMLRIKKHGYKFKYINKEIAFMRTQGVSSDVRKMHREELMVMRKNLVGLAYYASFVFNQLNRLRWRYFYKNPLNTPGQ